MEVAKVRVKTSNFSSNVIPLSKLKINMDANATYLISLDQSTSCTGITIAKVGVGPVICMEIEKHDWIIRERYNAELNNFLKTLVADCNVHTFGIEDVFKGTNPHVYTVLKDLRNLLLRIKKEKNNKIKRVERWNNLLWKSVLFNAYDIKGKNLYTRANSKKATAELIQKLYPWTEGLKEDGYDSLGMLEAFVVDSFNSDWSLKTTRKINKFIYSENRHKHHFSIESEKPNIADCEIMNYNIDLTPEENAYLATALCGGKVITNEIPDSQWYSIFCIEKLIKYDDNIRFYLKANVG